MATENIENKIFAGENNISVEQVEEAVISALLLDAGAIVGTFPVLKPEMFSRPDLAFIYQAVSNLYDKGETVDMITVDTEMRKTDEKRWKEWGGIKRVASLVGRIRHISGLPYYVEEVKRQYMLRLLNILFVTLGAKAAGFESSYTLLIEEAERSLLELRGRCTVGKPLERIGCTANEVLQMHRERLNTGNDRMRILSGIEEFDYVTGGLYNGELLVEGGRPSDGKTAVAMHIAMNVALSGKAVCFFSLEMTAMQTMNRLFAGYASVDADHLRIEGLTTAELERMERLAGKFEDLPLFFDHTPGNSIENIRAQVMLQKKKGQCDLVVIDYLHLMERKGRAGETMDQLVGRNIEGAKQVAVDANCPVLVLSQMNRNSVQRVEKAYVPELHDLRDSGVIEQVADCVFFVHRPERYGIFKDETTGESLRGVGKLYILKTRNGSTGIARFRYNKSFTRITNYDNRMRYEEE